MRHLDNFDHLFSSEMVNLLYRQGKLEKEAVVLTKTLIIVLQCTNWFIALLICYFVLTTCEYVDSTILETFFA